jgi:L-lactate utilization protein LutC
MPNWDLLANDKIINKTIIALKANNITAEVVDNSIAAKKRVLELIPPNSEVMNMNSLTLNQIGLSEEINESGKYNSVRNKLNQMNRETQNLDMQKLGSAPEYVIGSVPTVTQDGQIVIASYTGSQIPAYSFASSHVIWVVSTKKIVENQELALQRIYQHCLPLESQRVKKAYGSKESAVNKILIINKEVTPQRINLVFVKEDLGF